MKNKFDLRFTKTEYLIKSEFIKLLERKQFSDISVSEICKYALCSRNAFYAHYANKDDLLDSIINEDWIELINIAFFALPKFKN